MEPAVAGTKSTLVNPLQAQLLKAGLVKTAQLNKAKQEARQAQRSQSPRPAEAAAEQARLAQHQKAESDRDRNRNLQLQQERKAQAAQIRQMIETQRLDRREGESAFQFVVEGKIKKIHLHEAQRTQLIQGALALVKLGSGYELVPLATAEKIAQRDPGRVVVLDTPSPPQASTEPDLYADYAVPDDLMW